MTTTPKVSPLLNLLIKHRQHLASRDFIIDYIVEAPLMRKEEAIKSKMIKPGKLFTDSVAIKNSISFPEDEHASLLKRISGGLTIVTTRVSTEMGKYKIGSYFKTNLEKGMTLEVVDSKQYSDIARHPYLKELTDSQKELISKHGKFDVIILKKVELKKDIYVVTKASSNNEISEVEYLDLPSDFKLSFYTKFDLHKGMIDNFKESKPVETTIGVFILNQNVLVKSFGDSIPYVNGLWNIGKVENDIARLTISGEISPDQALNYATNVYALSGLNDFCVPALSEKAVTSNPEVSAKREELFAKYKDQMDDPNVLIAIEKELITMDKNKMKGDVSNGFMIFGKNYTTQRKRMFLTLGILPSFGGSKAGFNFSKSNLNDGWDLKELDILANDIRQGFYSRAKSTALGGAESKMLGRNFQDSKISEDDCHTHRGLDIVITETNKKDFVFRNIVVEDGILELNESNIGRYIGKRVTVRSPMYCATKDGYCYACLDTRFKKIGVELLNIFPIGISSTMVTQSLKKMHASVTSLLDITDINDILL